MKKKDFNKKMTLKLNKMTVTDLDAKQLDRVRGGQPTVETCTLAQTCDRPCI